MRRAVGRLLRHGNGSTKLVILAVWLCVIKLLAVLVFTPASATVDDISFGFGWFIESLRTTGAFVACIDDFCTHAARMPAQPLFFTALSVISENLLVAAILKSLILTVVIVLCFRYLYRRQAADPQRKAWVWFVIAGLLALSPIVIKHAATVHYEEGFLIELLFLWAFAFLLAVRHLADPDSVKQVGVVLMALVLAFLAYFFKSSMIAVFVLTLALAGIAFLRWRSRSIVVVGLLCVVCMGGWGVRNLAVTDHFSVMTSFDGQNSYRGLTSEGREIYPELYLDRLFDAKVAYLPDGQRVDLPPLPAMESFSDEWAHDRYYKTKAKTWLLNHPTEWLQYTGEKAWNFFVGIHKTPYTYDSDARNVPKSAEDVLTTAWLLMGRLLQVAMVGLLIVLWRRRDRTARALCAGVVAMNGAYAAPYLVGFNYERHVTTYLVIVAACVAVLLTEVLQRRAAPAAVEEAAT